MILQKLMELSKNYRKNEKEYSYWFCNIPFDKHEIKGKISNTIREETENVKNALKQELNELFLNEMAMINRLKNYKWDVEMPIDKNNDEVLKKIKKIYSIFPKGQKNNVFDLFEEYIYRSTPICSCIKNVFKFLKEKSDNSKKILIIISDGYSTDGNPLNIYKEYSDINNL